LRGFVIEELKKSNKMQNPILSLHIIVWWLNLSEGIALSKRWRHQKNKNKNLHLKIMHEIEQSNYFEI
jgi:hypothetical protein